MKNIKFTKPVRWCAAMAVTFTLQLYASMLWAQSFETASNNPGDNRYFLPTYPVAFVGAKIQEVPSATGIAGDYHIGTGVLSANNPDAGHHLWMVMPSGQVLKLFPLPEHQLMPGLIDSPMGQLDFGSVVEPNVSEDGQKLYFSYFHDANFEISSGSAPYRITAMGADLYVMDLAPLLANPAADPAALSVRRLTTRVYGSNGKQLPSDRVKDAMNKDLAANTAPNDWGTVHMHAMEMRTRDGLKLVYASDARRLQNSNGAMAKPNHNFNLHIADIQSDGSIANARQFHYYTTTSALSPTPLRNGIAFSYQASTSATRNWHIQGSDSAGKWYPVIGYGTNDELFHLGSFCVKTTGSNPGDYLVAARYYNLNNEGFGSLWSQDLSILGVNTYDKSTSWAIIPSTVGSEEITPEVNSSDYPSSKQGAQWVGKMTSPRCGGPDELFMAYSPTSANGRLVDSDGNKNIYHSYIAYRPNLEPFHPLDPVNVATGQGLRILVDDSSNEYTLVWPVPIMSWQARTGDAKQKFTKSHIDTRSTIKPGLPYAQLGTSALYNTDRRPYDCWLGPQGYTPFSPNKANINTNRENDLLWENTDGLTYVQDQNDLCAYLDPEHVLGVSVSLTTNKTNNSADFAPGYSTDEHGKKESARLLGIHSVLGQADQSFMSVIPANAPFEMHLLHRNYGMRLVDVRSWHSLKARETRNDCGGCHQHEPGAGIPFAGTVADSVAPTDMVSQTQFLSYDAFCQPTLAVDPSPALDVPEWSQDVWSRFNQYCGSCHNSGQSTDPTALAALSFVDESSAYQQLKTRHFADSVVGALGSPAFWAARGERTDGRDNTLAKYQPNYASGEFGYRFSAVHATSLNLCAGGDPAGAAWVYDLGQWIDNHMPRNTGGAFPQEFDRYHPSVDAALIGNKCSTAPLQVGFWDDSGHLETLTVSLSGNVLASYQNLANGTVKLTLPPVTASDVIEVEAVDAADNRQVYRKEVRTLRRDCRLLKPQVKRYAGVQLIGSTITKSVTFRP